MATVQHDAIDAEKEDSVFAVINNIPSSYHSADLRNYFSQFIESRGFRCFHFRHRPELQQTRNVGSTQTSGKDSSGKTTCCVVRLAPDKLDELIRMYNKKHWLDENGESMRCLCFISKIRVSSPPSGETSQTYKTRSEQRQVPADRVEFTESDLVKLPELNPPELMPCGNVGTPTMVFLDYIRQCRLPPGVIKKLGLSFPKTRARRIYNSVPFDYGTRLVEGAEEEEESWTVVSGSGHVLEAEETGHVLEAEETGHVLEAEETESENVQHQPSASDQEPASSGSGASRAVDGAEEIPSKRAQRQQRKRENAERRKLMAERIEEKLIEKEQASDSGDDNDTCEEWERHEATDDDPTSQGRCKERLFEEEIELKWEKGGSGLVFYTDAQYWHELEGDFDEQTADDLNVDLSAYYEDGAGDKDIRDFLTLRQDSRRPAGHEATDRFTAGIARPLKPKSSRSVQSSKMGIGKFERHTKGFGRRLLERQGWREGQGLGPSVAGMAEALENEGQHPKDKKGFGYHGEKLLLPGMARPKKARREPGPGLISTVYDSPAQTDPPESLLRRNDPTFLKHRGPIRAFTREGSTSNNG